MRKVLLSFFLSLALAGAYAQQVVITGTVLDEDNLSLPGAVLKILPSGQYTITDQNGKFEFLDVVPSDSFTIEVSYMGYDNVLETVQAEGKREIHADFMLSQSVNIDEVVIVGDRLRGQRKALNQQKNNQNITNIVSSDQVGRFPDANIGDALKRIPGITMQNDQGEARNIVIRGLASELNSVTLNGDRIPSAEGDNRKVQMDLIPSDMIQTIEVNKTLTSDMDADAIGGSVNLITRAAPNGQRISGMLAGGYNPIRSKAAYSGSFIYGNRFMDNKLGLVLSGSYNSNDYGSDNVEAVWKKDDFGNIYVEEQDIRKYDVKRVRRSISGALDYNINARNNLSFSAMYNWRDDWENRYRLTMTNMEPEYDGDNNITGYTGDIRRETKGGMDNNRVKSARLEQQIVQNYSLRGDHLIGSHLDMDWALSYSTAGEYRPHERYIEYETEGVAFNRDFGSTEFPLLRSSSPVATSDFGLTSLTENTDNTFEDELGARINFRMPLSAVSGQKGRVRIGGRLRLKNKERDNTFSEYSPLNSDMDHLGLIPNVVWEGKNFQPGNQYIPGNFAAKEYLGGLNLGNTGLFEKELVSDEFLPLNYKARETITAGYVRWDQDFSDKLTMIAGIRVENTKIDYEGNITRDGEELEGTRKVKNSYTNFLPSLAFKYKVNEDFILRAAYTTALARPNYYTLSPFVNTAIDDTEVEAGNPNLKASSASNFDLMAEYYFRSLGLISGGVFYKRIDNFIYTFRDEQFTTEKFNQDFPGLVNPVPTGEEWTLIQARNGEHVNVYGFEVALQRQLDFLPGAFLKGFGIYTNYTFTKSAAKGIYNADGEMREGIMLPGTAPHMFNASLSWENKRFSARVSLNYAAAYLDELGGEDFDDRYYDKQTFVDANAAYKITDNLRVFAEANNLTNQPLRYYQGDVSRMMQMEYYRQRYTLGLKLDLTR